MASNSVGFNPICKQKLSSLVANHGIAISLITRAHGFFIAISSGILWSVNSLSLLSPLAGKRLQLVIQSGMAVVLVEGEDQLDALIRQGNISDPTTPSTSGTAPSYDFNFFGSLIALGTMLNALVVFS